MTDEPKRGPGRPRKHPPKPKATTPGKPGRPKKSTPSVQQKRAKFLLNILKENHDFDIVQEIVKTYRYIETLPESTDRTKLLRGIQKDLLRYCYPVLKSSELKTDGASALIQLSIPMPAKKVSPDYLPPINDDILDGDYTDKE